MPLMHDRWIGPAEPATVRELRHAVASYAAAGGISGVTLDDVSICLSEAVTNAIVHAYRDGRPPGVVSVDAELSDDQFVLTVTDDGLGFSPRPDSPGLGLGLPTIRAVSSSVSIEPEPAGGTRVRMSFALQEGLVS